MCGKSEYKISMILFICPMIERVFEKGCVRFARVADSFEREALSDGKIAKCLNEK